MDLALLLALPIALPFAVGCFLVWRRRRRAAKPVDMCARDGHVYGSALFSCSRCGHEIPDPFRKDDDER